MNKKRLITTIVMTLLLTGCSLAKPEKTVTADDKMIGVFITVGEKNEIQEDDTWVTLGKEELNTNLGNFELDKKVLIGKYDDKENTYRFGNHKGFLCIETKDYTKDYPAFSTITDLDDVFVDKTSNMKETEDFDTEVSINSTLYLPEKSQDERLRFYNVFQSKDGLIYLDGTLDSIDGGTNDGEFKVTYEYKSNINGDDEIDKIAVNTKIKYFSKTKDIIINQYDSNGNLLKRKSIGVSNTDTTVSWLKDASFAIVEEVNEKEIKRVMINNKSDEDDCKSYSYHIEDNNDRVKKVEVYFNN